MSNGAFFCFLSDTPLEKPTLGYLIKVALDHGNVTGNSFEVVKGLGIAQVASA